MVTVIQVVSLNLVGRSDKLGDERMMAVNFVAASESALGAAGSDDRGVAEEEGLVGACGFA